MLNPPNVVEAPSENAYTDEELRQALTDQLAFNIQEVQDRLLRLPESNRMFKKKETELLQNRLKAYNELMLQVNAVEFERGGNLYAVTLKDTDTFLT